MKQTKRQTEVLVLIQKGCSNKVIARELKIAESTVKIHVGDLFKKYGAKNRTQLGVFSIAEKKPVLPDLEENPKCWIKVTVNKITAVMFMPPKNLDEWMPVYTKTKKGNNELYHLYA